MLFVLLSICLQSACYLPQNARNIAHRSISLKWEFVSWYIEDDTGEHDDAIDVGDDQQMLDIKLGERMIPCHKFIDTMGLSEVVAVSGEKIPDSDSYLIVYYPIFKYLSIWKAVLNAFYLLLILIFHSDIASAINWVIELGKTLI